MSESSNTDSAVPARAKRGQPTPFHSTDPKRSVGAERAEASPTGGPLTLLVVIVFHALWTFNRLFNLPAQRGPPQAPALVNRSIHTQTVNIPQKRPFHKESLSMALATLVPPSGRKSSANAHTVKLKNKTIVQQTTNAARHIRSIGANGCQIISDWQAQSGETINHNFRRQIPQGTRDEYQTDYTSQ